MRIREVCVPEQGWPNRSSDALEVLVFDPQQEHGIGKPCGNNQGHLATLTGFSCDRQGSADPPCAFVLTHQSELPFLRFGIYLTFIKANAVVEYDHLELQAPLGQTPDRLTKASAGPWPPRKQHELWGLLASAGHQPSSSSVKGSSERPSNIGA